MSPAVHDLVFTGCAIAIIVVALWALGTALGWLEWSVSIKAVPPWRRKATAPRKTPSPVPAADEAPAGTVSNLRAGTG